MVKIILNGDDLDNRYLELFSSNSEATLNLYPVLPPHISFKNSYLNYLLFVFILFLTTKYASFDGDLLCYLLFTSWL